MWYRKGKFDFFFFLLRLNYVISGYQNVQNKTSGSNPVNKFKCAEPTTETQEICLIYEICSKLTIEAPEQCWRCSGVFIVNLQHILPLFFDKAIADFEQINVGWETIAVLQVVGTLWMPSILFVQS